MLKLMDAPSHSTSFIAASMSLTQGLAKAAMADLGDCLKHWRDASLKLWLQTIYITANYIQGIRV